MTRAQLQAIRQRQALYTLAFDDRRVTRDMLRAQAEEFEGFLAGMADEDDRLVQLCRRLVEINPIGREREWWQTMDEIAKIVQ